MPAVRRSDNNDPAVISAQRRIASARAWNNRDEELAARRDLARAKAAVFNREAIRLLAEGDRFEAERLLAHADQIESAGSAVATP